MSAEDEVRLKNENRPPIFLLYLLTVFVFALVFTFWQEDPVPLEVHLAATLIASTCFIPIAIWYARDRQSLPIFEIIVLSYALQFSLPVYTQPNFIIIYSQPYPLSWEDIKITLLYVEAGILALIVAYYVARHLFSSLRLPQLDLPLDPDRKKNYLVGAILFGGIFVLFQEFGWFQSSALSALTSLLARQMSVAIIILAYDVFSKQEQQPRMHLLLYSVVAVTFLLGLITGLLENAFVPLALLVMVRWHATKRMPWVWLAIGILLYLILNPAKFYYRSEVWYGGQQYSFFQRIGLWQDLALESVVTTFDPEFSVSGTDKTEGALARFDLIHRFTYVRQLTPAYIPYYKGATYGYFLYAWIPRILWPDKPSASVANKMIDVDYRLAVPSSTSTIGIGQLPEAYVNFGLLGIVLILALQGVVFALLDKVMNGPRSEGGRAIYLSVMVYFINGIGSSSAILFGALFQQIFVNAILIRPFAIGFQVKEIKVKRNRLEKERLIRSNFNLRRMNNNNKNYWF